MPTVLVRRNVSDSDPAPTFYPNHLLTPDFEHLRELRAHYARTRDELLTFQKEQRDREWAKFFKEEANWNLKLFRAADAWFKWVAGEDGARRPEEWPHELGPYFDFVQALAAE